MTLEVTHEVKSFDLGDGKELSVALVNCVGRIESTTIQTFQDPLDNLRETGPYHVVLDFSGVVYISSTGLGGLFKYSEAFGSKGGGLCLVNVPEEAFHVIELLGVDNVVTLVSSIDDAIDHFMNAEPAEKSELTEQQRLAEVRSEAIAGKTGDAPTKSGNPSVLLGVPEDGFFSQVIRGKLEAKGIDVHLATEVKDALKIAIEHDVDLLVVDFLMADHLSLASELKSKLETGTTSLILLYEEGVDPTKAKTVQVMSNEYIVEPFDMDKLVDLIGSELERHRTESGYLTHEMHLRFPTASDFAAETGVMIKEIIAQTKFSGDKKLMLALSSACREAIDNACRHGNKWNDDQFIDLFYILDDEKLTISVKDQGGGFEWRHYLQNAKNSAKDLAKQRDFGNLGGLGIALMMRCVDEITYNEKGNIITLVKAQPKASA